VGRQYYGYCADNRGSAGTAGTQDDRNGVQTADCGLPDGNTTNEEGMLMMDKRLAEAILEALAVGDSFGKSTEFASRKEITQAFPSGISHFLQPQESLSHKDMHCAQVTDDTEQNVFLIEDYFAAGNITPEIAAKSILRWYNESAEAEKYIGPSSRKAIYALRANVPVCEAGLTGTSCGGVMRTPAAFLCSDTHDHLIENVYATLCPTHNTPQAMQAAMGYAFALWSMQETDDLQEILAATVTGCQTGCALYAGIAQHVCEPSCEARVLFLRRACEMFHSGEEILDFLFYVMGTTISSCDVFTAAFALFLWAKKDVLLAVRMAAMLGGDTDTIGCLAAVLCTVFSRGHNLPLNIVQAVKKTNPYDFGELAEKATAVRSRRQAGTQI
jgi:ADP-ribosylglycohydrolase